MWPGERPRREGTDWLEGEAVEGRDGDGNRQGMDRKRKRET